jgi:3-oxoacyl-[acyl-carrier protein] reductase
VYAATKYGLRGVSIGAAVDLAPWNILINTVSPGFTLTDMARQNYSQEERERIEALVPLGRMAQPEEVAKAVLFLASNLNTYITGQSLVVDGGYSII